MTAESGNKASTFAVSPVSYQSLESKTAQFHPPTWTRLSKAVTNREYQGTEGMCFITDVKGNALDLSPHVQHTCTGTCVHAHMEARS